MTNIPWQFGAFVIKPLAHKKMPSDKESLVLNPELQAKLVNGSPVEALVVTATRKLPFICWLERFEHWFAKIKNKLKCIITTHSSI